MASLDWCFEEARRRWESFGARDGKTLDTAWVGLGHPTQYKPALDKGFMKPIHGRSQPDRGVLNWFQLTEAGVEEYRRRFPGSDNLTSRKYRNGSEIKDAT